MTAIATPLAAGAARAAVGAQAAGAGAAAAAGAGPIDAFAAMLGDLLPAAGLQGSAVTATGPGATPGPVGDAAADGTSGTPPGRDLPDPGLQALAGWQPLMALATTAPGSPSPATVGAGARPDAGRAPSWQPSAPADAATDPFLALAGAALPAAAGPQAARDFQAVLDSVAPAIADASPGALAQDAARLPGLDAAGPLAAAPAGAPALPLQTGAAHAPVHQASLPSHPLEPAFAGELGAEVRWMLDGGQQQAELHLNPTDLGPIRIQLSLHAQGADISLVAAHATTREGLQQSLPALRDLLAGQGLQLGQAHVSDGGGQHADRREPPPPAARGEAAAGRSAAGPGRMEAISLRAGRGMLDLYA